MTDIMKTDEIMNEDMNAMNPVLWADIPDPDVIRVGDFYYMVSTTMHLTPGVPVMRSKNLVDWDIVSYVYDVLVDDDRHNLQGGTHIYGKGSWAASLRYHEGIFYVVFACNETNKTYIYKTDCVEEGLWKKEVLSGLHHDPSLLFDEDGKVYLVYGNGIIRIKELNEEVTAFKEDGIDQILVDARIEGNILNAEGSHLYKIGDRYYLFLIDWPGVGDKRRTEWCYRSDSLLGEYEGKILLQDDMGFYNNGVAQGGIVDTPEGDWYAMLFQDHGAVGRIPVLVPVQWKDGWPTMGTDGKVPFELPLKREKEITFVINDEFDYREDKLALPWQWNHNPDKNLWSVTTRPGFLRLTTGNVVPSILEARNTLSQRTLGPIFVGETKLDISGLKAGDYAGLSAFSYEYGLIGVTVGKNGNKSVVLATKDENDGMKLLEVIPVYQNNIHLKVEFVYNLGDVKNLTRVDKAHFSYSLDGRVWHKFEYELPMRYTLDHFMGYRIALFQFATKEIGGYADFDYFRYHREMK